MFNFNNNKGSLQVVALYPYTQQMLAITKAILNAPTAQPQSTVMPSGVPTRGPSFRRFSYSTSTPSNTMAPSINAASSQTTLSSSGTALRNAIIIISVVGFVLLITGAAIIRQWWLSKQSAPHRSPGRDRHLGKTSVSWGCT